MKKILYTLLLFSLVLPVVLNAATFSFLPNIGTFEPGDVFDVNVYINPEAGEKITTAKLAASFDSTLLEISSFTQESGWFTLTQPGYDSIDNSGGVFIKTGGFPSGISTSKKFGVITIRAKAVGSASFSTNDDSLLLNSSNQNKYSGDMVANFVFQNDQETVVALDEPTIVESTKLETTGDALSGKVDSVLGVEDEVSTGLVSTSTEEATTTKDQLAAAGEADSNTRRFVHYAIGVLIILLAGVFVWKRK